ncbi:MAG: permease [Candidatus Peribacteraceae bacterium]|nr:permease [Candidatus Peribacteraceae bacterium]
MLQSFAQWVTFDLLRHTPGTGAAEVTAFFVYDSVKILLLLFLITQAMSLLHMYLPIERIRAILAGRNWYGFDYFLATFFGAITPFCSCSSIPLFIGFLDAGIPLGVSSAFLITSPLVNEIAIGLLISLFGWNVTMLYVSAGILIGMAGGFLLQKLNMERFVDTTLFTQKSSCSCNGTLPSRSILRASFADGWQIFVKVLPYVLVGVAIGAVIHGQVPDEFFAQSLNVHSVFAVPLAVLVGVPLYSNASGVIPIVQALIAKGIPLGTGLAFMMAIVGLSFPEAMMLKRVMKLPLLAAFFGIVTLGLILIGYAFNELL